MSRGPRWKRPPRVNAQGLCSKVKSAAEMKHSAEQGDPAYPLHGNLPRFRPTCREGSFSPIKSVDGKWRLEQHQRSLCGKESRPRRALRRSQHQTCQLLPPKCAASRFRLMQPEFAFDKAEVGGRNQPTVRHANAVERAVEIGVPEAEEIGELGEARGEIVVLPDIALQKPRIIRQTV